MYNMLEKARIKLMQAFYRHDAAELELEMLDSRKPENG